MDQAGKREAASSLNTLRHQKSLCQRSASVVERSIGYIQAGQLANHGLEFENALQRPLRDLRLIGRVGGVELSARNKRVDHNGNEMIVGARAQKIGARVGVEVVRSEALEIAKNFRF